jgi:hypothetical protein
MSGRQLTQSEYALQHIVMLFVEVLFQLEELCLARTYQDVYRFCELENIGYLAVRYLKSGPPPFKEWAEEWLREGEVSSSHTKGKDCGGDLIWRALA